MLRWRVAYTAAWVAASMVLGIGAGFVLAVAANLKSEVADAALWIGGLAGALLGVWVAVGTARARGLHRALRVAGPTLLVVGVLAATSLFALSGVRRAPGVLLSGFLEFELALCAGGVALAGIASWLAGVTGRRLEA